MRYVRIGQLRAERYIRRVERNKMVITLRMFAGVVMVEAIVIIALLSVLIK